jgi:NADPH:quinone reductase-like Zn-dependent oxidoreductase
LLQASVCPRAAPICHNPGPISRLASDTMKVFQIQDDWGIDHLQLASRPAPRPGPGEVLLKMRAASLNYRDLLVPNRGYGAHTGTLPLIPLSDGVGEVVETGVGVTRVKVGERACPCFTQGWISGPPTPDRPASSLGGPLDGTMAEYMAMPEAGVVKVPDYLSDEQAATLPCAALTAWSALMVQDQLPPGSKVLVQGTGGVALFALQFAKLAGAHVTVISSSDEKIAKAKALGADAAVNYRSTPEWAKATLAITGGRGYDHIVELGGEKTLPQSLLCVRTGGTISIIGVLSGGNMSAQLGRIVMRQVRLQGIGVGHRDGFEAMLRAMAQHRVEPVIDRAFAFDELKQALAYLQSGLHFGKVCIRHGGA